MGLVTKLFGSQRHGYENIVPQYIQTIKVDDEFTIVCKGYQKSWFLTFFRYVFCVAFIGIPYLFLRWYPDYEAYLFWSKCELEFAEIILVKDQTGHSSLRPIFAPSDEFSYIYNKPVRYFVYKLERFFWCCEKLQFRRLSGLADGVNTFNQLLDLTTGLTQQQKQERLITYGKNTINVDVKSCWQLLADEILNPFYVFEALSVILWVFDEYHYYALFITVVSVISIQLSLKQTRKQCMMVRNMASALKFRAIVLTPDCGRYEHSTEELVPGDVIEIPPNGCKMMCDALLLSGTCIVNESSLTGESLPVTKVPPVYGDEVYMPNSLHMRHTLFCGTQILQTRYYENNKVLAIVTETGSTTAKGQLLRSILYPKTMAFDFMIESIKFIFLLFGAASFAMVYSVYLYIIRHASLKVLLLRTLDLITIVVPPTLPAAMTAGTYYSQKRLRKKGIFCISPSRIVVSGKTNLVCFDKTGTLTEDGMDVWGVLPVNANCNALSISVSRPPPLSSDNLINDISLIDDKSVLKSALAACHSLTVIDNQICGNPLDVTMFKATDWELEEPGEDNAKFDRLDPTIVRPRRRNLTSDCSASRETCDDLETCFSYEVPYEIGLIRQFPFTSSTQNMTVICRILGARNMIVFSKGAPEKMMCLCSPNTIPENIESTLSHFTMAGFRVIALAYKEMPKSFSWAQSQKITRVQVEKDLQFIGLLLMQNNLKEQSAPVINQLKLANIKCIMATGDNIMTAVSVSRNCGILAKNSEVVWLDIDESSPSPRIKIESLSGLTTESINLNDSAVQIVMKGNTWSSLKTLYPLYFEAITIKTAVFARMSPLQKTQLIELLQQLDYYVTMCGDGANDCGALKAAHVGISLSRTEASIAAPFTSREGNVMCVADLIKEGRCALVTSFGLFNYMAMYSLIQFFSVIILYTIGAEIGTFEFLYVDLVMTSSLVMLMGFSGPSDCLIALQPTASLLSLRNVVPLMLQIITVFLFQLLALCILRQQPWYVPVKPAEKDEEVVLCWENTTVYLFSCFQFLIFAFLYSQGRQHRQSVHRNWLMLGLLTLLSSFTTVLVISPPDFLSELFEVKPRTTTDGYFRIVLIIMPIVHLLISNLIEVLFSKRLGPGLVQNLIKKKSSRRYKTIENQSHFDIKLYKSSISCDQI